MQHVLQDAKSVLGRSGSPGARADGRVRGAPLSGPPGALQRLLERMGLNSAGTAPARPASNRLAFAVDPAAIYAIGDVHGELQLLRSLEAKIATDAAEIDGEAWIVVLGDVIDRGPSSAQVIDHLMREPPAGLRRFVLKGNHEAMLVDLARDARPPAAWLDLGGRETLQSYGVPSRHLEVKLDARTFAHIVSTFVPKDHLAFLESLPVVIETPSAIFVHAGLQPGVALDQQLDDDLLWFRDGFAADYKEFGRVVVHGHTPRDEALVTPFRVAIDTGACLSGRLTAARIAPGEPVRLLVAEREVT